MYFFYTAVDNNLGPPPFDLRALHQNRSVNVTHESALERKLALIIKISILNKNLLIVFKI
jgi:hypothetical protein